MNTYALEDIEDAKEEESPQNTNQQPITLQIHTTVLRSSPPP